MKNALCLTLTLTTLGLTACGGNDSSHTPSVSTPAVAVDTSTKFKLSYNLFPTTDAQDLQNITITHNGKPSSHILDLAAMPNDISSQKLTIQIKDSEDTMLTETTLRAYKQPNSIVLGMRVDNEIIDGVNKPLSVDTPSFNVGYLGGNHTKILPSTGIYNYKGKSFGKTQEGSFEYTLDFGAKTGQGKLDIAGTTVVLQKADLKNIHAKITNADYFEGFGVEGLASGANASKYTLGVFGDQAEEVAGYVSSNIKDIHDFGFGGTKQ